MRKTKLLCMLGSTTGSSVGLIHASRSRGSRRTKPGRATLAQQPRLITTTASGPSTVIHRRCPATSRPFRIFPSLQLPKTPKRCEFSRGMLLRPNRRQLPRKRIGLGDRKSTRLNSSHGYISYAVFCLKKKTHTPDNHPSYVMPSSLPRLTVARRLLGPREHDHTRHTRLIRFPSELRPRTSDLPRLTDP